MTLFIVDASHWQSGLPISGLRGQGIVGLIAKATQGQSNVDEMFADFLRAGRQAGLLLAAYHYLERGDPAYQRQQAVHTASVVPADIPVWVDVEAGATRDQAYVYADELGARGRIVAGIYNATQPHPAYGGWWRAAYGIDPAGTPSYAYAANGGDRSARWDAGTIRHPDIWQFCQHGRLAGYTGDVDLNAYRGTLEQLVATGWFWVPPSLRATQDPDPIQEEEVTMKVVRIAGGRTFVTNGPFTTEIPPEAVAGWCAITGQSEPQGTGASIVNTSTTTETIALIQRLADQARAAAEQARAAAQAALVAAGQRPDVDEAELAGQVATLLLKALPAQLPRYSDEDLAAIAGAVNDEQDTRSRARLGDAPSG